MGTGKIILSGLYLALLSVPALAEQDILSSIPQDAFGFAAVKSPQALFDNLAEIIPPLKDLDESEDPMAQIKKHLGDVNLNAPAALVILSFEEFSDFDDDGPPIAFLLSAENPQAILEARKAEDQPFDLPPGVIQIEAGYMGIKDGFIVFAPEPEHIAAVLTGQGSVKIPARVRQAYEAGKIVGYMPVQQTMSALAEKIEELREELTEEIAGDISSEMDLPPALVSLYMDIYLSAAEQAEDLIVVADINQKAITGSARITFQPDSPAAQFVNSLVWDEEPSYRHLPAGAFIFAGAQRYNPQTIQDLLDALIEKAKTYPDLAEKLSDEQVQETLADIKTFCSQFSGAAGVANMGSPATGMLSLVARFDVTDPVAFKAQIRNLCDNYLNTLLSKLAGVQLVYTQSVETFVGVPIDTIRLQAAPESAADPEITNTVLGLMPMLLGPELSVRIASPNVDEVFLIIGGGFERAERVINVAQGFGSSLAKQPSLVKALADLPSHRIAESHLHLGQYFAALQTFIPQLKLAADGSGGTPSLTDLPLVSVCDSVEPNTYRQDIIIPAETITTLVKLLVPPVAAAREEANAAVCMTNVRGLDQCLVLYAASHNDQYPDPAEWREILIEEDLAPEKIFTCPSNKEPTEDTNDYVFVPWPDANVEGNLLVVFERQARHKGKRNVVTGAHGVMRVDEAEFQEMLARTIEALQAQGIEFTWPE